GATLLIAACPLIWSCLRSSQALLFRFNIGSPERDSLLALGIGCSGSRGSAAARTPLFDVCTSSRLFSSVGPYPILGPPKFVARTVGPDLPKHRPSNS
ncbi:hypothetical protein HN51_066723, partial [Arachis hypogaea]